MKEKREYKGNVIVLSDNQGWVFESSGKLVSEDVWCKCGHCGLETTKEDHDGCLGELIGVMNACCGHGVERDAYVQFLDGETIGGKDARIILDVLKKYRKEI